MKKKFLAVILAICMMSFFSVPFFAAEKVDLIIEPGKVTLSEICVGNDNPSGVMITLINNGSGEITIEEPRITNQDSYFEIGSLSRSVLLPGETAQFSLAPKEGLAADYYQQELFVKVGGYEFSFTASIKINSHSAVYFNPKGATCTENGYEGYWYCGNCGGRFSDQYCTKEVNSDDIVIESQGHSWEEGYTIDKEATCTEAGEKSIHCVNCDERKDIQEIPMTEHSFGDWEIITEATCAEDGLQRRTCSECGFEEESVIHATGHSWEIAEQEDAEDSQENLTVVCVNCGEERYSEESQECEHQFGEWQTLIEPTCTEMGCEERQCELCGFWESRGIDVLPHNWEEDYTIDKNADCFSDGVKSIHCADCGAVKDETVIPQLEHDFGPWTELEDGSGAVRTCSICGTTENTETMDIEGQYYDSANTEGETEIIGGEQEENTKVLLASFTTVITNDENAKINMSVAAASCSNSVILPGETWSFNSCTGDSNLPSNGYVLGTVIENGSYTKGYGGGICQVSSTIYKAAVCANLDIVERHYHYWASDYTKAGFDATINYGSLDLKLRNTTDYPIYLQCSTDGNTVTASFYGWKDPSYDSIVTYSYNYHRDDGYFGTDSYRVYIKNGQEIYREKLPGSKYKLDEYHDVWNADEGTICADENNPERSFPVAKEPEDIGY